MPAATPSPANDPASDKEGAPSLDDECPPTTATKKRAPKLKWQVNRDSIINSKVHDWARPFLKTTKLVDDDFLEYKRKFKD